MADHVGAWLKCEGQRITAENYPQLHALGYTFLPSENEFKPPLKPDRGKALALFVALKDGEYHRTGMLAWRWIEDSSTTTASS